MHRQNIVIDRVNCFRFLTVDMIFSWKEGGNECFYCHVKFPKTSCCSLSVNGWDKCSPNYIRALNRKVGLNRFLYQYHLMLTPAFLWNNINSSDLKLTLGGYRSTLEQWIPSEHCDWSRHQDRRCGSTWYFSALLRRYISLKYFCFFVFKIMKN